MAQYLKLLTDWQRSIAHALRELGRRMASLENPHLQMSDPARRFYASDEVRHAVAVYRAGKDGKSEDLQAVYCAIGRLRIGEALELFRDIKHSHRQRGRPSGSGPFVSDDNRLLKTYDERVAAGEAPQSVKDELGNEARTYGGPKAGKDRLQRKIRRRKQTPAE